MERLLFLLEVIDLKNIKCRIFAGIMLPTCATVGVAFSSKAFARQTTKIGKVQGTIARGTSATKLVKADGVKNLNRLKSGKLNEAGPQIDGDSDSIGASMNNISGDGKLYNDSDGSLAGIDAEGFKSLGEMLENVSNVVSKNDSLVNISSVDITGSKVRLTTNGVFKVNSLELASAYNKACEQGYCGEDIVGTMEKIMPSVKKEEFLSAYFDSLNYLGNRGIGIYVNVTSLATGEPLGQVCIMPDPSDKGAVKLQIWAVDKESFDSTLSLVLNYLGKESKVNKVSVSVGINSGKNYVDAVRSVFNSKPKLFKKFNEIKKTDYMRLEENDKGETVLVAGSTKSVNGAEPVKEAADEIVLKDKGEISAYKSLISAGKLKFGSANKEQDKDSVSVFSTDYEFIK